jgi:hypothetical protein
MKDIDWKHYLSVAPDGNPTEWLNDIFNAFCKQWIDYFDAYLTVQNYRNLGNEFADLAAMFVQKIQDEERRQDMTRARIYKEQNK